MDGSFEMGRNKVRAVGQMGEGGSAEKGCTLKTNSRCTNPTVIQFILLCLYIARDLFLSSFVSFSFSACYKVFRTQPYFSYVFYKVICVFHMTCFY